MDFSTDNYESDGNQSNPFFTIMRTIQDFVRWLIGIFTLTEEERLKAGIFRGGGGCD